MLAWTLPILLTATLVVLSAPPVIWNVPALLNVGAVPPLKLMPFETLLLPFTMFQRSHEHMSTIHPHLKIVCLLLLALTNVVVPDTFSVRASRNTLPVRILIPPLAF